MNLRPLTFSDFDALVVAFNEAFSDYLVPFQVTPHQLRELLTRRGWVPAASVGAFEGGRMVGFTVNGIDGDRAYDSGTGVVPSHRRTGLGRQMMEMSFELLQGKTYVLEVLEANERAVALYRGLGFQETRRFQCWSFEVHTPTHAPEIANPDLDAIRALSLATPSWQNDVPSLRRARDTYVALGNEDGTIVFFPSTGDVALLGIRGEAVSLLNAAATRAAKPLRILNIDDRDAGIAAFLESAGAKRTVRQIEMVISLR